MTKSVQRKTAFAFGVIFVVVLLVLAMVVPNPTPFQYTVFRIVLALAAAGVAAMVPGFLEVQVSGWIRAGGALAVFVVVFFYNPAAMVVPESQPAVLAQSMTNSPGGIQVGGDLQVNVDRRLTGEVVTNFVASLNGKPCHVRVGALGVGGEPDRLTNDILLAAQRAGCQTEGVFHGVGFEVFDGIRLQYAAERPLGESIQAMTAAFRAANLAFVARAYPSQSPGSVYVFVGYRPQ